MKISTRLVSLVGLVGGTLCLQAASTIQLTSAAYTVAEGSDSAALTVQRLDDLHTEVSVDYATADSTATNGVHYCAVSGTLTFAAAQTNLTIVVPILNRTFAEGTRAFRVILGNPSGGAALGVQTNSLVSILDNDVGIQFRFASYSAAEGAGAAIIGVVRGDDGALPTAVDVATSDLTARAGSDYIAISNTLTFGPTERLKLFSVPLLNDMLKEPNRTIRLALSNPIGGTLGATRTTTVTITDDDQGFQLESAKYSVAEDAGAVLISVLRGTDETTSAVSVDYATAGGTATSGVDYSSRSGTLSFPPGERVKLLPVPILNDGVKEPTKSFSLTLRNPGSGAELGAPLTTTVSILDNDPGLGFEAPSVSVWEKSGEVSLTVVRGNDGALGPISVDYATSDLIARAGTDYQAISGTLHFDENETLKSLSISLLRDDIVEGNETFRVTLSNPTGGATLGTATATATILESYCAVAPPADPALAITRDCGVNVLTWTGGGQLQRADRVVGPWQTLTATQGPYFVQSPVPAAFYRVTRPRPVNLYVPSRYDGQTPMPLVILLHGFGDSGQGVEDYIQLRPLAEGRGFLYCYPDAAVTRWGPRAWNATDYASDAAADWGAPIVDDAGYLRGLIEEITERFAVDPKRVYVVGRSAGGAMCYRMACQCADLVAGIASHAGTTFFNPSLCAPAEPVNVLHIHGTADEGAHYWGGANGISDGLPCNMVPYPGAVRSVETWAGYNGADDPVTDPAPTMDLVLNVTGLDTVVTRYTACPPGGAVELWTINGSAHRPPLSPDFAPRIIDWLLAHPKP